jgi:small-conductance mechanosensitive channel
MKLFFNLLFALCLSCLSVSPALSADSESTGINYVQLTKTLTDMEKKIKNSESALQDIDNDSNILYEISAQLETAKRDNEREARSIQKQIDALGAEPEDGIEELDVIANKRKEFKNELAVINSRISETNILQVKIEELNVLILNARNQKVLGNLFDKQSPLAQPQIFVKSLTAFVVFFWDIVKSPVEWYKNLDDSSKSYVLTYLIPAFFILIGAFWLGLVLRRLIMRNMGYRQDIENPRYGHKLLAAVSVAIAYGVIPALIIGGMLLWMIGSKIFTIGFFGIVINSTLYYILFIIMARAFARVTFAPWNGKWRLVNVETPKAIGIVKALYLSIELIGIGALLEHIASYAGRSEILQNFLTVISCAIKAFAIILIASQVLFGNGTKPAEPSDSEEEEPNLPLKIMFFASLLTIATFAISLFGYPKLSAFILNRYIITAILVGLFMILKRLFSEVLRRLLLLGFWGKTFRLRRKILTKIDFGLTLLINPILALFFAYVFLNLWGISGNFILHACKKVLFGFEVGGVRISLLAIVLGIAVFFGSLALVKVIKTHLTINVFSKLDIDDGIKHSMSSGVSFIGFILSTLLAIIVMGGDLSSLAVIAGALSVGIGFGLQNITNNLVSGIIILFERPIKIGDWVIINGEEGQIKQINIRSTELETFQKTSVIIPNATLLSSSLTNLTHGNNWTRQSVKVGVAYGTDVQRVTEILLECAKNNKKVLKSPAPYVLFKDFGASSLDFELRCYSNNIWSGWSIPSELRYEINKRFQEEGIEIPFQQIVVHQGDTVAPETQFYAHK